MEGVVINGTENFKPLTEEQLKAIPKASLAKKYGYSAKYIRQILDGTRGKRENYITRKVREDASLILSILEL